MLLLAIPMSTPDLSTFFSSAPAKDGPSSRMTQRMSSFETRRSGVTSRAPSRSAASAQDRHGVVGDGEIAVGEIQLGAVVPGAPLSPLPALAHRRDQLVEVGPVVPEEHLDPLAARALLRVGVEPLKDCEPRAQAGRP